MVSLHFPSRAPRSPVTEIVGPDSGVLRWISVRLLHLTRANPDWQFDTGADEAVMDILGGACSVNVRSPGGSAVYAEVGERLNVFAGKPTMVYLPRSSRVSVFAETESLDAVLVSAPALADHEPVLVNPADTLTKVVGADNWQRTVVTGVGDNVEADRLLVGETFNPPGNWSSAPPHKHDVKTESEAPLEEIYYYKVNPARGFGLQRVYTPPDANDSFDVTYAVRDGDLVAIPRGYHPVVAAPGYQLFYLWALAGEERRYGAWSDDPAHAWIKGAQ